jgi:PAS domain S-box-containing protein
LVLHEITELRERLQSVADPIGFLVSLFSHTPLGFAIWKTDGHLLLTNKAFRDLFGSEPPPDYNILQDEIAARSGLLPLIRRAFDGETTSLPTFWYDPRDLRQVRVTEGKEVAISMMIFPLFNRDGSIEYVAATYKDETEITLAQELIQAETENLRQVILQMEEEAAERQRAEEALQASEQHFKALIQNAADVIQLVDAAGVIRYVSPAVSRILGYAPEELLGRYVPELLHPDEFEFLQQSFSDTLSKPGHAVRIEQHIRHKDGSWRWVEVTATNLFENPSVGSMVVNYHDITDRKMAQEEILKLNEVLEERVHLRTLELETINKELEAFSYSVSHDLRAPLRAINSFSSILLDKDDPPSADDQIDYLQRVYKAGKRMEQLINDLLDLSRVTRREMYPTQVNLSSMAQSIADDLRRTQSERQVEFLLTPDLMAEADANLLGIVLENLLSNAWKYTSKMPSARIEFGVKQEGDEQVYFVRDNGVGFDMAYAGKLFSPFQRLHREEQFEGTGIGLATVQRIINRHGGRVWVEAAEGEGATFYFLLPERKENA